MADFLHLSDTSFPDVGNVDVYKYKNEFDYSKYDKTQMTITVCSVPWDVGLIHVGNAQIGGLGNVVKFIDKQARDRWFDNLNDKYTWQTKYRAYHTDGYIEVPLPYEKCVLYNYVYVEYETLPVDYAQGGKDKFFFFIRSCESLASNTCKVEILCDTWQTYIYDINIAYMMLERGHAPMSLMSASRYLQNPIENCSYLTADDVNYGTTYVSRRASEIILNDGDMWACIVTSADLSKDWGTYADNAQVPANVPDGIAFVDGQPSMRCYAIEPNRLANFLTYASTSYPQFYQTVQGVFFVKKELIHTYQPAISFAGFDFYLCYRRADYDITLADLNTDLFGYADEYKELAKLYTYPYAYLEISNENGNIDTIRIEETSGNLSLNVTTSIAYPWLAIDGRLSGIGIGGNDITFANVNSHSFKFNGDWFNHLQRWNIPTFAVTVAAATVYEYETYYERKQKALENETALQNAKDNALASKTSADASANTTHDNALRSALASKNNADASANTTHDNALRSALASKNNADASANTAKTNTDASADTDKVNADNSARHAQQNAYNSAQAAKDNADNSANAAHTNAISLANTGKTNSYNSSDTDKTNANNTALAAYNNANFIASTSQTNAKANAETANNNAIREATFNRNSFTNQRNLQNEQVNMLVSDDFGSNIYGWDGYIGRQAQLNMEKLSDDWDEDWAYNQRTLALNLQQTSVTTALNTASTAANNIGGGIATGMSAGVMGAAIGAVGGLAASTVAVASAGVTVPIMAGFSTEMNEITNIIGGNKVVNAQNYLARNSDAQKDFEYKKNQRENVWLTTIADSAQTTSNANAAANKSTADSNATRNYNTDIANAGRTYDAATTNADNTFNTTRTNADNTAATAIGNADNTYNAATTNATNTYNTAITNADNNKQLANTNADNTQVTTKANALRTQTTALANNTRTYDAAKDNADDAQTTALANNTRTYNAAKDNADDAQTTALANNKRTYDNALAIANRDKQVADAAIQADINQAGLKAPYVFGDFKDGENSLTRPQGVFCNVVTQSKDAIEQAGDYFLRFGYAVNRAWKFTGFNLMPHFTYWKCSDIWVNGNNVPDAYMDEIRFFLLGGVCVWNNPDDIGKISIYDN